MPHMDLWQLVVVTEVSALGAEVKGVTGSGLPALDMSLFIALGAINLSQAG